MKELDDSRLFLKDRVAGDQWIGQRESQQDNFLVIDLRDGGQHDDDAVLCILADGMGGAVGGAIASDLAVNAFAESYLKSSKSMSVGDRLCRALDEATQALNSRISTEPGLKGMGCTLVAALIVEDMVRWISVGDSPFWLFRNHSLTRLNKDHSMKPVLDALVEKGELTRDEADRDGQRNALRSAMDGNAPQMIDLQSAGYRLQPGDVLVLASDGLETLSIKAIEKVLEQHCFTPVIERVEKLLVATSNENDPYQDNTTVILMDAAMSEQGMAAISSPTRRGGNPSGDQSPRNPNSTTVAPNEAANSSRRRWPRSSFVILMFAIVLCLIFVSLLIQRMSAPAPPEETTTVGAPVAPPAEATESEFDQTETLLPSSEDEASDDDDGVDGNEADSPASDGEMSTDDETEIVPSSNDELEQVDAMLLDESEVETDDNESLANGRELEE